MDGQHQEGSTTGTLRYHGNEAGIDRAEVVVVDAACDRDAVVAALSAGRFPQNLTEPGAAERPAARHLQEVPVSKNCVIALWNFIISLSIMQPVVIIGFHRLINNKSIPSISSESFRRA